MTAVVLRELDGRRQVLLVRRADNGQWTAVTGIIEPGEDAAETAEREVLEEASVVAEVERLAWVSTTRPVTHVNGDRAQYLDHTFVLRWVSGEPAVGDDESTDTGWYDIDDLPPMTEVHRRRIEVALRGDDRCLLGPYPGR